MPSQSFSEQEHPASWLWQQCEPQRPVEGDSRIIDRIDQHRDRGCGVLVQRLFDGMRPKQAADALALKSAVNGEPADQGCAKHSTLRQLRSHARG
jgi:hypothetical protein